MVKILKKPATSTIIAVLCGFVVACAILLIFGYNPLAMLQSLFNGVFAKPKYITNVIIKATPIILTGISVAFAFKTGLFNIGAEGQYIIGSIAGVVVGTQLNLPMILQIPIILLSGIIVGAIYGGIVGFLKAKFGIHEVITSIMLNWIAFYLSNYVSNNAFFHKPNTTGTYSINKSGFTMILYNWKVSDNGLEYLKNHKILYDIIIKTDLNFGFIIAVIVAIIISFLLNRTTKGFELRSVGFNQNTAKFTGINVKQNILISMLIAGAISGLAGVLSVTSITPHNISTISTFENNGFNGLSVALIANSSPIGCIFSGILFSGLIYGGRSIQSEIGVPSEIISVMIGIIVFFVALTKIIPTLAEKIEKRGSKNDK